MKSFFMFLIMLQFLGTAAQAGNFRSCVSAKVSAQIKATPCSYQAVQAVGSMAQNACLSDLIQDTMAADRSIHPGSPEFASAMLNKKVSASSDTVELIQAEAHRCGDTVTINPDGSSSSSHSSVRFSYGTAH